MSKHFACDKRNCFGNIDGYCEPLVEPCNKKKCPFFKTQNEIEEAEKRSASFSYKNITLLKNVGLGGFRNGLY